MDEFETKIEQHRHEFYRFIYRNVWDSGVAEDVFSSAVLAAYDNRIVPVLKENRGQGSAFNAGLAASRGEVVLFLDASAASEVF